MKNQIIPGLGLFWLYTRGRVLGFLVFLGEIIRRKNDTALGLTYSVGLLLLLSGLFLFIDDKIIQIQYTKKRVTFGIF